MLGKKHSEETKKKIGDSNRGKKRTLEERKRMSEGMRKAGRGGDKNPYWRGGRIVDSRGYVRVLSKKHPRASTKGYYFEHRLVAEKALGRFLKTEEVIHHINGDTKDNRNKNLLVCAQPYHKWLHKRMGELYINEHFGGM